MPFGNFNVYQLAFGSSVIFLLPNSPLVRSVGNKLIAIMLAFGKPLDQIKNFILNYFPVQ